MKNPAFLLLQMRNPRQKDLQAELGDLYVNHYVWLWEYKDAKMFSLTHGGHRLAVGVYALTSHHEMIGLEAKVFPAPLHPKLQRYLEMYIMYLLLQFSLY